MKTTKYFARIRPHTCKHLLLKSDTDEKGDLIVYTYCTKIDFCLTAPFVDCKLCGEYQFNPNSIDEADLPEDYMIPVNCILYIGVEADETGYFPVDSPSVVKCLEIVPTRKLARNRIKQLFPQAPYNRQLKCWVNKLSDYLELIKIDESEIFLPQNSKWILNLYKELEEQL